MKIITTFNIYIDRYDGHWNCGVYYPGVGNISKIVNPFDCKVNNVVWEDRKKIKWILKIRKIKKKMWMLSK